MPRWISLIFVFQEMFRSSYCFCCWYRVLDCSNATIKMLKHCFWIMLFNPVLNLSTKNLMSIQISCAVVLCDGCKENWQVPNVGADTIRKSSFFFLLMAGELSDIYHGNIQSPPIWVFSPKSPNIAVSFCYKIKKTLP